ncbi:hypothetical protein AMATHDRAFT_76357 [Amanita thiersii Skay4041]|uniref:DUF4484 domain-containing protein n=1 Tax=Amanita thiersii Skay4041 TaxID=703135 RepID=A0A2A9NNC3_9AGAR|nr:hypothetical protein AMATHDRAFT_76357 [Amanita thiersii Skay4041]
MSSPELKEKAPQDIVAIFHASFHPTRGNVIDWFLKASNDLNLDHVEFSVLPSGLHLMEQDVVYFTKDGQHGVCVFKRRKTTEEGHRGFHLTSLGILLAKSRRPRPWRHVAALKELAKNLYARFDSTIALLLPLEKDWEPARMFFEERKVRRADLGGAGDWNGWSHELEEAKSSPPSLSPTMHLSHLLRILGPSFMTLYKHVIGRRRILIFTLPPVEPACILCYVAADMCFEHQVELSTQHNTTAVPHRRLKGRTKEGISVLGMVTLSDLDRLRVEGQTGRGWIACTTDALFLEKPEYYDLLIDLTTSTPNKATRPTFYTSKLVPNTGNPRGATHRISNIRFAWSDVKLWNELERILGLDCDNTGRHSCCGPPSHPENYGKTPKLLSSWPDAWRVYEDVCIICAGLWMGSWRGNSTMSYSTADGPENWGAVRLEGDDDFTIGGVYIRNRGMGIEGGPNVTSSGGIASSTSLGRSTKRSSAMSWTSSKGTVSNGKARMASSSSALASDGAGASGIDEEAERQDRQLLMTLALLQTFHAHTTFHLSVLESFIPSDGTMSPETVISLAPKDILMFELGPLSGNDARYLEWLTYEYANGSQLVVKRGWRDLLNIIFGYG